MGHLQEIKRLIWTIRNKLKIAKQKKVPAYVWLVETYLMLKFKSLGILLMPISKLEFRHWERERERERKVLFVKTRFEPELNSNKLIAQLWIQNFCS